MRSLVSNFNLRSDGVWLAVSGLDGSLQAHHSRGGGGDSQYDIKERFPSKFATQLLWFTDLRATPNAVGPRRKQICRPAGHANDDDNVTVNGSLNGNGTVNVNQNSDAHNHVNDNGYANDDDDDYNVVKDNGILNL